MAETEVPKDKRVITVSDKRFDEVMESVTGGKTAEEIKAAVDAGRWPFAIPEDEMRAELELMRNRSDKNSETTK